jgi:unsaturated chondroitin disaccharide hydrolase
MIYSNTLTQTFDTIRRTIPKMGTNAPCIGNDDLTYARCERDFWVEGFWSGQLWLAYDETKDTVFRDAARAQRPYFFERLDRPESQDHDMGFLYSLSLVADYKLTRDIDAHRGALRAAESLAGRYNANGRFIRAWNDWPDGTDNRGRIIIDCMENLGLLFWATKQTGDAHYKDIASAHAHTTADHIVRTDGSSYHTFHFDPDTGVPLRGETIQGYADESCWSRGQSWAIHGYAMAHSYTGEVRFRDTAVQLADYALARLPEDNVPLWDYLLPEDKTPYRDTSAGAIMAAGLFLLADQLDDAAQAKRYRNSARAILDGLIAEYTTFEHPSAEGLLTQGASHVKRGYTNNMLPYGDYFLVEALLRAEGRTAFFW